MRPAGASESSRADVWAHRGQKVASLLSSYGSRSAYTQEVDAHLASRALRIDLARKRRGAEPLADDEGVGSLEQQPRWRARRPDVPRPPRGPGELGRSRLISNRVTRGRARGVKALVLGSHSPGEIIATDRGAPSPTATGSAGLRAPSQSTREIPPTCPPRAQLSSGGRGKTRCNFATFPGRGGRIRTDDLRLPKPRG